jgi:uncharacterized membrane protein YeaQ/YmgE (transglycosylase-associated protein family)
MSMLASLIVGLVFGAVANRTHRESGGGLRSDLAAGGVGGLAGGLLVQVVDALAIDALSGWSIAFAALCAVSSLIVVRSFAFPRRAPSE